MIIIIWVSKAIVYCYLMNRICLMSVPLFEVGESMFSLNTIFYVSWHVRFFDYRVQKNKVGLVV